MTSGHFCIYLLSYVCIRFRVQGVQGLGLELLGSYMSVRAFKFKYPH